MPSDTNGVDPRPLPRLQVRLLGTVEVILDGRVLPGIANLGQRPTFQDAGDDRVLEVHVFDFAGDLYGRELEVCFLEFVRGERRFASKEELRAQIARDVEGLRARLL